MNLSDHHRGSRHYGRAFPAGSRRSQPGGSAPPVRTAHGGVRGVRGERYTATGRPPSAQWRSSSPRTLAYTEIDEAFSHLRINPQRALDKAQVLWERQCERPALRTAVAHLKARALVYLNQPEACIAFIDSLEKDIQNDKNFLITKSRALQAQRQLHEALPLFQRLYTQHRASDRDYRIHALALGRHLQRMGGSDNLEQALAIFTELSRWNAGRERQPFCHDKEIELTLGRHLERMGGMNNQQQALDIFTRLRTRAAKGRKDTPCDDQEIELALGKALQRRGSADDRERAQAIFTRLRTGAAKGPLTRSCHDPKIELTLARHLQLMGGTDNLKRALSLLAALRAKAAGGRVNTPCDDRKIELSLGILLQGLGGMDNQKQALSIYTRLRTSAARGKENSPCDDKAIELALASCFIRMGLWQAFDDMHIEAQHFSGFEPHLCLSIRYFHELMETRSASARRTRLLGKALGHAALAVEKSDSGNVSCISQLAHCLQVLSHGPQALLQVRDTGPKEPWQWRTASAFLFELAYKIEPDRQQLEQDLPRRQLECELLSLLARQGSVD